ncbi:MAG TPA: hypothetical protein VFV82_08410 [Candidatus Binatia bacterium]|nr:hypothetical protein [Candidatus Binatia bacterium]
MLRNPAGKLWTIPPMHNGAACRTALRLGIEKNPANAELKRQFARRVNAGL